MKKSPLILLLISALAYADPFMGEGKQGYIKRCTNTASVPGLSGAEKNKFCICLANKLETAHPAAIKSIKKSDTMAVAQQKMNAAAMASARACMK